MKIAIANDHSAVELKNIIKEHLESKGYEVLNLGTDSTESCDYPVYGEKVGRAVADGEADLGIAICGTGVGISLAANKVKASAHVSAASRTQQSFPECTTTPTSSRLVHASLEANWQR